MTQLPQIIETPEGPRSSVTGGAELRRLLSVYEERLTRAGVDVAEIMRPGLSASFIIEELEREGLRPNSEVVAWFEWHDGLNPNLDVPKVAALLSEVHPASFSQAIHHLAATRQMEADAPDNSDLGPWTWGKDVRWLQLEVPNTALVVACDVAYEEAPGIRLSNNEFPYFEDAYRAVSLCTVVTWWIKNIDSGARSFDSDKQLWNIDVNLLDPIQRKHLFWN